MRTRLAALLVLLLGVSGASADDLERAFMHPPDSARPWVYWFWLNGNITREGITADLEAMERAGIGGVLIMEVDQGAPLGPVAFASPEWRDLFRHVVTEAHRLGLEVNMNNDAGWTGSGGPWVRPEHAMQKLTWSETAAEGSGVFEGTLPAPPTVAGYYQDVAVLAFPTPAPYRIDNIEAKAAFTTHGDAGRQPVPRGAAIPRGRVVDLTSRMRPDGGLRWDVPEGRWTILRIGHTPTGATNAPSPQSGRGLECDKLSNEAMDAFFAGFMAKLVADVGPLAGKTLVATHIDSWEVGSQNWSPRFREEFRRRRGYDPLPLLPIATGRLVESPEFSERFLWDLRMTVSDLVHDHYAGRLAELARRHGMRLTIEAYGGPCDDLPYAGRADEPMAEFWIGGGAMNTAKEMSSAAHVYGKRVVGAEAFTATDAERWLEHPGSIKSLGDRAFCEGINRFVFHRYAMQPWRSYRPGMTMGPWGIHYERTNTWWEQTGAWHRYLARCQHLLRQGLFVADILALRREDSPLGSGHRERHGYDYDECSAEALLTRARVKEGRIVFPDGMSYGVLVLPHSAAMTPILLRRVRDLTAAGATVIGEPPSRSPSLQGYPGCDAEVRELAAELWAGCDGKETRERRFGKGRVVRGRTPEDVLAGMGVPPDFTADRMLRFIHRRVGTTDLYFVANAARSACNPVCAFRVTGKLPEVWHPETGAREPAASFEEGAGVTRVRLRLEAGESLFVVFRRSSRGADPVVKLFGDGKDLWAPVSRPPIVVKKAVWGAAGRTRDVTGVIREMVDDGRRAFVVASLVETCGDPAPMVLKTLRVQYRVAGEERTATATDPETVRIGRAEDAGRKIEVLRALWGPPGDEDRFKDVTAQVRRVLASGVQSFQVASLVSEGDPAPNVVKTLRVDYEVEGRPLAASATDPEVITFELPGDVEPPIRLECRVERGPRWLSATVPGFLPLSPLAAGRAPLRLRTWAVVREPAAYTAVTRSGRKLAFDGFGAQLVAVAGPWEVRFEPGGGAPVSVTLDRLLSWHEHSDPGVRFFSGAATYRTSFEVAKEAVSAGRRLTLDLGDVRVVADVAVNGRPLGTLWRAPYRVDVTGLLRAGRNTLEVKVANLPVNRMIGDESLPEDSPRRPNGTLAAWPEWVREGKPSPTGRQTFTSWRLWRKSDPLQPSGLLGPVRLLSEPVATSKAPG